MGISNYRVMLVKREVSNVQTFLRLLRADKASQPLFFVGSSSFKDREYLRLIGSVVDRSKSWFPRHAFKPIWQVVSGKSTTNFFTNSVRAVPHERSQIGHVR